MNRREPVTREAPIGERLQHTVVELALLSSRFTDAVSRLSNGCAADSTAMIRSAQICLAEIHHQSGELIVGIEHAIQRETAK